MKIGIISEGKIPPDNRVALTPKQCAYVSEIYPVDFIIEPSEKRCFADEEYAREGLKISSDLSQCDVLMGVKEVPVSLLYEDKTYFFFSHTIKKQPYNRKLLQALLEKKIRMIDYEVLKDVMGQRLIAFGHYAGIVGAHNALWTYGKRTGLCSLNRACESHDYELLKKQYKDLNLPAIKICLTGNGRVANGAIEVLKDMKIREVSPEDYLNKRFDEVVFTQLHGRHYVRNKKNLPFVKNEFYNHPERFESAFGPYAKVTDVFINAIFWDSRSPQFFSLEEMKSPEFKIKVIADVTCDIAPKSSVPSTLKASTIADPVYGYNPQSEKIEAPFQQHVIDVMAIDNLPNELPRDASEFFGNQFIENILTELLHLQDSAIIENATITKDGKLTPMFEYLSDYVEGN
ncbi:MAG: NAD(P)-dependent oxidoreductase [Saprospiraceae bacterium]